MNTEQTTFKQTPAWHWAFSLPGFRRRSLSLAGLFWLLWALPAAALDLRVAIKKGASEVQVGGSTAAIVRDETGKQVGIVPAGDAYAVKVRGARLQLQNWQGAELWIEPTDSGTVWIGDRWYRGDVRLSQRGHRIDAINYVDLDEYLYSVVGAEMYASWPLEALKAQAVAARTYALYKRTQAPQALYDVDTTTATQVYKGLGSETPSTVQAVRATAKKVMVHGGQAILAAYHSSSGGHTENVEDIWSSPLPYLRGVADYDRNAPVYQWSVSFSRNELSRRIGGVGTVLSINVERATPRGRIVTATIVGDRGTKQMSGADLQRALGLRSRLFTFAPTAEGFQVNDRGFGHGVGMSQWGAKALAEQGWDFRRILAHYYSNVGLSSLD